MNKMCSKCNEIKDISEFYYRNKEHLNTTSYCKKCCNKVNNEFKKEHKYPDYYSKEKRSEYNKNYTKKVNSNV